MDVYGCLWCKCLQLGLQNSLEHLGTIEKPHAPDWYFFCEGPPCGKPRLVQSLAYRGVPVQSFLKSNDKWDGNFPDDFPSKKKKTFSHSTCGHFSRKPLLGWSAGRFNYGSWSCACWFSSQLISPTQKWGPSACWVQRFVLAGFDASPSPLDDLKASVHWFSSLGNRTNSTQNRIDFIYGNFGAHIFQFDPSLLILLFFF